MKRTYWEQIEYISPYHATKTVLNKVDKDEAHLVSSLCCDGIIHMPVLDLDFTVRARGKEGQTLAFFKSIVKADVIKILNCLARYKIISVNEFHRRQEEFRRMSFNRPLEFFEVTFLPPCRLVSSTTPMHFHLYIDKSMSWKELSHLLRVLNETGLIDDDFYNLSKEHEKSFLFLPGMKREAHKKDCNLCCPY